MVELQEAERRALASELHDRVGQSLAALSLNLKLVARGLSPESAVEVGVRIDDCLALVEDTVGAIRGVMSELRPQALDDYGLPAALRSYAKAFSRRTGIDVKVTGKDAPA